ncbi:protein CapL [Flavobacteriaceae bacterium UJ101]|nr:protein CapL [Flavobacteriaceae bacterium UJ101]
MRALNLYNASKQIDQEPSILKIQYKKSEDLFQQLIEKKESIAIVGLGYVGLPLALEVASKFKVIGFDINTSKIEQLKLSVDPCDELSSTHFLNKDIRFTNNTHEIAKAKLYIIAVPTPVNKEKKPNLNILKSATQSVAKNLKKGDIVVFESTVYPGCTEEVCIPILEAFSGLKFNQDFFVGYSPERINPGDTKNTFSSITKIVSGSTNQTLETISKVYNEVVTAGIHKAPSIKVAEAAKIVENTQRDVNIALMNELKYIFDKMNISTQDVLKAAGTKWNFLHFFPGLVGGHCIGVDPYYLIHKATELDVEVPLIKSSRLQNENLAEYLARKVAVELFYNNKENIQTHILVRGITFKENVKDIRNSKVANLIYHLKQYGYQITIEDPYASSKEVQKEYNFTLTSEKQLDKKFDAVIMAVNHETYHTFNSDYMESFLTTNGFVLDIRGTFDYQFRNHRYLTL